MKLKVEDHPGLVRDSKSKAIINVDDSAYKDYRNRKNLQNKMINMTEEINDLKNDIGEIKLLLNQILQRN